MRPGGPVIICHHGVNVVDSAADPVRLVVSPAHLESQIRVLQRAGYRFLTVGEILDRFDGGPPRGRVAALTFDDGWRDAVTVTAPLLERLGVRGTFYVCPGWFGGRHPNVTGPAGELLDEAGVRELHERGQEVAPHTLTHPDLRLLDDDELARELGESKARVEELLGTRCPTLAYPFGLHDERVERATAAAGFELALAWSPGPWRRYAAPRLPGPTRRGGGRLALKLLGVRVPNRAYVAVRAAAAAVRRP